jgi:putative membrane-bound dehydrogenase-like protein
MFGTFRFVFFVLFVSFVVNPVFADPLTPKDELATFKTLPGFKVELVASEPGVIDPVAMAFDERGRLFVCEMRGYPNGGVATGVENRGRVRCLTDKDGDGVFETSVVYAEGLRFPTGVLPWKGGVIVCVAPDVVYLPDKDGDNKADEVKVLYTGFGLDNIQQIVNSPRWGIDNWVYCTVGNAGGSITCPSRPEMKPLNLRGRGIRFRPDDLTTLEPTSGGGQYGLTCDEAQHWFVNTNSQHLRQIVLPDHYLRRNPYLAVPAVAADIPQHGAACQVFRISPFEQWRVERTTRRKDGPEAKRLPATELVPGGYITSACSPCYYGLNEPLFPEKDRGCVYVCDPANNLITRDKLVPDGSIYRGARIDEGVEFLASTDNWFRPVHLTVGPEGALYILDFYREVIETPLSLPDDIKKRLNLESRERGRIWRVVPDGFKTKGLPRLDRMKPAELIAGLNSRHEWVRSTAQRLLIEEKPAGIRWDLYRATNSAGTVEGVVTGLWTMAGLGPPDAADISATNLASPRKSAVLRIHMLRLAQPNFREASVRKAVAKLADDESPFVRFQVALTAGELPPDEAAPILAKLLRRSDADVWLQSAVLSSAKDAAPALLESLAADPAFVKSRHGVLGRLAALVGARDDLKATGRALELLAKLDSPVAQIAILDGLGQGTRNSKLPLNRLWDDAPADLKPAVERARRVFEAAASTAQDESATPAVRQSCVRLLAAGPYRIAAEPLAALLGPRSAGDLQSSALRSLASFDDPRVADVVLAGWGGYGPTLRREAIEVLFARKDRLTKLLDAIESKTVVPSQLEAARADALRAHADPAIRARAVKLLAGQVAADRKKVLDDYRPALDLKADAARGRDVFRKNCTACHRLENTGYEVGANLTAALRNKTKEALVLDILDPSREVDPRFVNYQATTTSGRTVSGLLAVETPTSVTLRRGERADDTILRSQIEELRATTKSLMPEEFEKQIDKQQMADLVEYLMTIGR